MAVIAETAEWQVTHKVASVTARAKSFVQAAWK